MANHKSIITLFDQARPPYDLQRQGFPLKFTLLTVDFYPKDEEFRYKDPYISRVCINKGRFIYLVSEPGKKELTEVYQETYAEAEAFYNSMKKTPTALDNEYDSPENS